MIRKETLSIYDKWVQPTEEEIQEVIHLCGKTQVSVSKQLGISAMTLMRWKKGGISYSDWALLVFMAGLGDIIRPENTEEEIEYKLKFLKQVSFIYHKKLSSLREKNKLLCIIEKKNEKELEQELEANCEVE